MCVCCVQTTKRQQSESAKIKHILAMKRMSGRRTPDKLSPVARDDDVFLQAAVTAAEGQNRGSLRSSGNGNGTGPNSRSLGGGGGGVRPRDMQQRKRGRLKSLIARHGEISQTPVSAAHEIHMWTTEVMRNWCVHVCFRGCFCPFPPVGCRQVFDTSGCSFEGSALLFGVSIALCCVVFTGQNTCLQQMFAPWGATCRVLFRCARRLCQTRGDASQISLLTTAAPTPTPTAATTFFRNWLFQTKEIRRAAAKPAVKAVAKPAAAKAASRAAKGAARVVAKEVQTKSIC